MTYVVFWSNRQHVGHVAIYLSAGSTDYLSIPSNYVSFGPDQKNLVALSPFSPGGVGKFRTLQDDQKNEFNPRLYEVDNLNTQAMRDAYAAIVQEHPKYNLFHTNCAAIAKKVLLAGGLSKIGSSSSVQNHWSRVIASSSEKFADAAKRIPGDFKGGRLFEMLIDLSEYISPQNAIFLKGKARAVGASAVVLGDGAQFLRELVETPGSLEALIKELGGRELRQS